MLAIQNSHKQNTTFRKNIFMIPITAEYCSNLINMLVMRCFKERIPRFLIKEFSQILGLF